jgi:ABC-type oligopeptide transport system substrate-binding subunit/class 3 adenylate cyclase
MICTRCGTENPQGARFCMGCAARLILVCTECGFELPPGARFCVHCASPVAGPDMPGSGETQQDRLTERFWRLVPKEYAERLLATRGQVTPERRTVTILFSDVKGSTAMAENLDPEDVLEIMDGAFDLLIEPVTRHEGTLARLMGDAILAFFGAPIAHEDDPERACLAALEITAGARRYAEQIEAERGIKGFNVRAGIHTGLVVVGEVGSDLRVEYTAMGDAINLAARMEQNAPPGGVLITNDTYRQVRGIFDVVPQPPLTVKGKAQPVQTYLVERAKPRPFRKPMRGVEGIETRMVGREAELKHLQDAFHTAREDVELQVVTVTGDVGVGKSRLLHEFDVWAEVLPDRFYYFKGRAFAEMQDTPYGLLRNLITYRFQIQDSDAPAAVREKLEAGVDAALGDSRHSRAAAHYLGHLLGLEFGESEHLADKLDDAQGLRDQALAYLADYFTGMAAQLPVLILLEDLHWADDSSLDALTHLSLALTGQPVMLACAARPTLFERRPHWGEGQAFHSRLMLQPLSKWDSRRLVAEILQKVPEVPQTLRDLIVTGAEGNPFFIEELIKMLVEDGMIVKGEEQWRLEPARLAEIRVPQTLTGVLQARLDHLPPEERTILQQASVVGRLFWDRAVAHIYESTGGAVDLGKLGENLSELREREMVYQRETSTFADAQEYIFRHALLREVTYGSVLKRLRRSYHGLVADWLLEHGGQRVEEITSLIADHLALAGRTAEAADYLLQAGDRARSRYAPQEAIRAYDRAVALLRELGDDQGTARTLMKLGLTYEMAFDFRRAHEAYQEGFTLWQRAGAESRAEPPPAAPHALRLVWWEPTTLDPAMFRDIGTAAVIGHLFSGLVEETADMAIVPGLARSWAVSDGGRRYTFRLRGDVTWSDGVPVTAHDFAYAWRRMLDPAVDSPNAGLLYDVAGARAYHEGRGSWEEVGVQAVDDRTLVMALEDPTGYVLHLVATPCLVPVPRHVVEGCGEAWTECGDLVSNGPFRLASRIPGERITLARNPRYHGRREGNVDRIKLILNVPEPSSAGLALYEGNALDVLRVDSLLPAERDHARQRHAGEYLAQPEPSTSYIIFNPGLSPFDDLRVRRAFALGTDREQLASMLVDSGLFFHTGGLVPPGVPGHSPGIALPYDPGQGQCLLAEAGYPGGAGFLPVAAVILRTAGALALAEALAGLWHDTLGIHVDWEILAPASFIDHLKRELPQMYAAGWVPDYPDPDTYLRVALSWLTSRWHDEMYEELVERARRGADQAERMRLYGKIDRMLIEKAIVLPLGIRRSHLLIKPWVSRYPLSPFGKPLWKDVVIEPH